LFGSIEALGKQDGISELPSIGFLGLDLGQGRAMYALIWTGRRPVGMGASEPSRLAPVAPSGR